MIPLDNFYAGRKSLPHLPPKLLRNQSIILFLTICTKNRKTILNRQEVHELMRSSWTAADSWKVGRYILMPDHIHLFCSPNLIPTTSIKPWVKYWKSIASKHWPSFEGKPIWQRDFFDRQLRAGESYRDKWNYVIENPVRAGLVSDSNDWPYQGELNILEWHDPI